MRVSLTPLVCEILLVNSVSLSAGGRRGFISFLPVCVRRGPQRDPDAVSAAVHHDPESTTNRSVNATKRQASSQNTALSARD